MADDLKQLAIEFADDAMHRARQLDPELVEAKLRVSQIENQLEAAKASFGRAKTYQSKVGENLTCPRCWVLSGNQAFLKSTESEDDDDRYRCPSCHTSYAQRD